MGKAKGIIKHQRKRKLFSRSDKRENMRRKAWGSLAECPSKKLKLNLQLKGHSLAGQRWT